MPRRRQARRHGLAEAHLAHPPSRRPEEETTIFPVLAVTEDRFCAPQTPGGFSASHAARYPSARNPAYLSGGGPASFAATTSDGGQLLLTPDASAANLLDPSVLNTPVSPRVGAVRRKRARASASELSSTGPLTPSRRHLTRNVSAGIWGIDTEAAKKSTRVGRSTRGGAPSEDDESVHLLQEEEDLCCTLGMGAIVTIESAVPRGDDYLGGWEPGNKSLGPGDLTKLLGDANQSTDDLTSAAAPAGPRSGRRPVGDDGQAAETSEADGGNGNDSSVKAALAVADAAEKGDQEVGTTNPVLFAGLPAQPGDELKEHPVQAARLKQLKITREDQLLEERMARNAMCLTQFEMRGNVDTRLRFFNFFVVSVICSVRTLFLSLGCRHASFRRIARQ